MIPFVWRKEVNTKAAVSQIAVKFQECIKTKAWTSQSIWDVKQAKAISTDRMGVKTL